MNLLSSYLTIDAVRLDLDVTSQKRLFEEAGMAVENACGISHDLVFSALIERERLGSTALGNGCAVPHGRLEGITTPAVAFLRTRTPLKVAAPDNSGAQLFIVIVAPGENSQTHLDLLSETARLFNDSTAREALLAAVEPIEICEFLARWESQTEAARA